MSSSLSRFSETARTAIERICLQLPQITTSAPSSERKETPSEPVTDDEGCSDLLPPEERVMNILETHGGRVWQADVITHTGWSKAKVSRVLSEMESTGEICRFRSGRQKVVCVTETTPESMIDNQDTPAM